MIDSGSQSSACKRSFAPGYGVDDSEPARLWDIQNNKIGSYGKKVVDVEFLDNKSPDNIEGSLRMDVSDVGKNVASMGRLLRAGFDMHFTSRGHECWMEHEGRKIQVFEDDENSDAPLYSMRLRVKSPPREAASSCSGLLVAPIGASEEEIHEGCEVELAGLTKNHDLNGMRGKFMRKHEEDSSRWVILVGKRIMNVKLENIKRLDSPVAEVPEKEVRAGATPVALRDPGEVPSKAMVESHNLTHVPAVPWCEICVASKCISSHHSSSPEEPRRTPQV